MVIKAILSLICVAALIGVWTLSGKRRINTMAAWAWSGLWVLGLALTLFPELASRVATAVGVGRGVDFIVYLAVLLAFYLIFRIFVRLERIEGNITSLVSQESIRRAESEYADSEKGRRKK
ncbi:DUF2304 domain-containing protein [Candidatus Uhrbacteria bacterium]|nr:DUF2304 domain-containing protein [Candidatus Uhrbacteria bacterium]